jgi:hypothetical protein
MIGNQIGKTRVYFKIKFFEVFEVLTVMEFHASV